MRLILVTLLMASLILPEASMGVNSADVLEKSGKGIINWSKGTIQATCEPSRTVGVENNKPSQTLRPFSADNDKLRAELLDDVLTAAQSLRIDNTVYVRDFTAETEAYLLKIRQLVDNAQIVLRTDTKDRIVRATARIPIYGGFAQLVLPRDIKQVQTIQLMMPIRDDPESPKGPAETAEFGVARPFTGLIVDARNIAATPALVPTIYDETGDEVYGPAFVSREFAVQYGLAGYTHSLNTALGHIRVTDNPLIVRGLRLHRSGPCNIVISNLDAARIRNTYDHLSFLRRCQVIIVID